MRTLAEFEADFASEVGVLSTLVVAGEVERWINEGRTRIRFLDKKVGTITWNAGDVDVDLPSDLIQLSRIQGDDKVYLGRFERWGLKLYLADDVDGATDAGTAKVFYQAYYPVISSSAASTGPEEFDRGLLSYALFRFFKKLSSNRVDYKRYSTIVGQNAVHIDDLQAEADRHYSDFADASEVLPPDEPVSYYGDGAS